MYKRSVVFKMPDVRDHNLGDLHGHQDMCGVNTCTTASLCPTGRRNVPRTLSVIQLFTVVVAVRVYETQQPLGPVVLIIFVTRCILLSVCLASAY